MRISDRDAFCSAITCASASQGLDLDLTAVLGGVRSKRYSAVVDNGVITKLNVEPTDAPTGMTCSLAEKLIL